MQFEMTATVFSVNKITVEGRTFCSMFTGQNPVGDNAENTLGLEVTKISAEPAVFDQLKTEGFRPGQEIKLVAMLKKAANGKSQPHIVGVVPSQKTAPTPEPQKKPA
ncbi:hypothetical protein SAMN05216429_106133 [Marinobacter persicus]|uniref:Uncharacterized protein n=1 Tax=Marinobacter persicus TaxID=930118 RepID=A0A1I3UI24_9GAMM|nr:hypothetical protein [Marinobacter persicus]GHD52496.1 hypothetical protein GCM10008110_25370 [Marinobacter persicus]SFJ82515.1 hypothetical protein SAMN05216429_106133 [Marinobacter persicus]